MENPLLNQMFQVPGGGGIPATNPDPLDSSFQVGGQSVYSEIFPEKAPPSDPYTRIRVKIAKAFAERKERQRKVDEATMPFVQRDVLASQAREQDITTKISEAMDLLNQPAPVLQQGPNQGELMAAALGGLLAPDNIPHVLTALSKVSGARNEADFDAKLRQFGLTRESAVMALRQLQNDIEFEKNDQRQLRNQEHQLREQNAKAAQDAELFLLDKEMDLELAEIASQDKRYIADLKAEIEAGKQETANAFKQIEFALRERDIAAKEEKEANLNKDRTERRVLNREKFEKLSADQKAKLSIATKKLSAEFGRLSEQQKRTAIMEQTLGVSSFNAETGRYHAELRAWENQMKSLGLFDEMSSFFDMFVRPSQTPPMPTPPQVGTAPPRSKNRPPAMPGKLPGPIPLPGLNIKPEQPQSSKKKNIWERTSDTITAATKAQGLREKYKY